MLDDLRQLVDDTLLESMPAGLKRAIDTALQAGATHKDLLRRAKQQAGGRTTTVLQIEAYLESLKTKSN